MLINATTLQTLFRAFNTAFSNAFAGVTPTWNQVATEVPSGTRQNDYGWMKDIPGMREWIGDRHIHGVAVQGYSIVNKKFELTVGVKRDDIADDNLGVYTPLMGSMGDSAARHPDELIWAMLADGFNQVGYDGQNYFDTDHPVGDGAVSNMTAGAGNPWFLVDDTRPLKPLILQMRERYEFQSMTNADDEKVFMQDLYRYGVRARLNAGFGFWQMAHGSKATLDATNYEAARVAMLSQQGDTGRKLGLRPTLLVCGPSNEAKGRAVLEKERTTGGEDNIWFNTAKLLVTPYLS